MNYASTVDSVALRMFELEMDRLRGQVVHAVDKMVQPILEQGMKAYDEFCRLAKWVYEAETVYANTKSEARALLKRRLGRLPTGAGLRIIKQV